MKGLIFTLVLFTCLSSSAQQIISGIVKIKNEEPLPGAIIIERGTPNGTQTDIDGNFSLTVSSLDTSVLIISYVGFRTQEFEIKGRDQFLIEITPDCNIDFFDSHRLWPYLVTGVLKGQWGGELELSFQESIIGTPMGYIGYTRNDKGTEFLIAQIELSHLLVNCFYQMDLIWNKRDYKHQSPIWNRTFSFETIHHFEKISIAVGVSKTTTDSELMTNSKIGPLVGFGYYIGKPIYSDIQGKISYLDSDIELRAELKSGYNKINSFLRYYQFRSFTELSIGIGYRFFY